MAGAEAAETNVAETELAETELAETKLGETELDGTNVAEREPASAKDRLLRAAVEQVAVQGVSGLSLRQLAAALGTSHRMLIYHFGSKEGLLVELLRVVERQQRDALADLRRDLDAASTPGTTDAREAAVEIARRFWRRLADPALWPYERLFFEVYGQALREGSPMASLLEGIVDSWLDPLTELTRRLGVPSPVARDHARLGLAVTRGLLLDLLATGDRAGADRAMEAFIATSRVLPT